MTTEHRPTPSLVVHPGTADPSGPPVHEPVGVDLQVNGRSVTVPLVEGASLLVILRDHLQLRGARMGCGVGECGACTVLVDGAPLRSCITPLDAVAGARVTTPEGLGGPDDPHPIQQAFIDLQAAQCGYCINGMMMSVAALAERGEADRARIGEALSGNLCRCGTHARILEAACRALGADRDGSGGCDDISRCRMVTADTVPAPAVAQLPELLRASPRIEQWLAVREDGTIELCSGRSEVGQGVHAALAQIVAAQLGVSFGSVVVRTPSTREGPDEGYTSGSRSMQEGSVAVGMAAAALRRVALQRASALLGAPPDELRIDGGAVVAPSGRRVALGQLVEQGAITGLIDLADQPAWDRPPLGSSPRRTDLAAKLTGAPGFVHDVDLPGMVHARAVLPPTYEAGLAKLDVAGVEHMEGVLNVVRDGRLIIVIADTDHDAARAVAALEARARWEDPGLDLTSDVIATLRSLPATEYVHREDPGIDAALSRGVRIAASYSKPYQAHGAMAPSCAVALLDGDELTVWCSTQGVRPLRRELAALLDRHEDRITVVQEAGPGCYGQNAADDAAAFAAVAAGALPGRPVRFQFSSSDEFGWEPYGSAMAVDLEASLSEDGRIIAWRHRALTDTHIARPQGQGDRLVPAWLRDGGRRHAWVGPNHGGGRNAEPIYDLPAVAAIVDHVEAPLRTGSLRSLGAFFNVFAAESFMDELAELAGQDPLAFRLAHLTDERARAVLEAVAAHAGWEPHVGPSGRGRGIAVSRYHGRMTYVAMIADAQVDLETNRITVHRLFMAADAGAVVHAEGLRQQLEGGAMQGLSRTLHERLAVDRRGVRSRDWSTYDVLRFPDVPTIDLVLLNRPGAQPLGAGEASTPLVPAAVANAIDDATGIRMRDLPITPQAIEQRLLSMDESELERMPSV